VHSTRKCTIVGDVRHLPAPAARLPAGRWPRTDAARAGRETQQPPRRATRENEPTPTGTLDAKAVAVGAVGGVEAASTGVGLTGTRAEETDEAVAAVP